MKPIHFRGVNYDPVQISKMSGQGHRAVVSTADVIAIASAKAFEAKIAVMFENKYHLLTGSVDLNQPTQVIHVISKIVLKKATVETAGFAERSMMQRTENQQQQHQGFNSYSYDRR